MQGFSWFSEDQQRQDMLQRWTIAFVRCSMSHVREECNLEAQLRVCFHTSLSERSPGILGMVLSGLI